MTTREVSISLDALGKGKVIVDGHDLSQYVSAIALNAKVRKPTEVSLTISWFNLVGVVRAKVDADVSQIPEDIAALLYKSLRQRFFTETSPAQFLTTWAERYPDIAADLVRQLSICESGGIASYIRRSRAGLVDRPSVEQPTTPGAPQTPPQPQPDTSGSPRG